MGLGNGKTDGVGDTLAERAGCHLNAGGVMGLGVAGGDAVDGLLRKISSEKPQLMRNTAIHTRNALRSSIDKA